MPRIDFSSPTLELLLLVRVSYSLDGEDAVARWTGPGDKAGSGAAVRDAEGDGVLYQYESRIVLADDEISAGGLDENIQVLGQLSLAVAAQDGSALHDAAVRGRWANRRAEAWAHDVESGVSQQVFRGVVAARPSITEQGFSLLIRDELAGREASWPATQMPLDTDEWTHNTAVDTTAGPTLFTHLYHPNQHAAVGSPYYVNENDQGAVLGPTWVGTTISAASYAWVQAIPYGSGSSTGILGNSDILYVHAGPKQLLACDFVAWEDPTNGQLRMSDGTGGDSIDTYWNNDPASGPIGLTVALITLTGFGGAGIEVQAFSAEPFPRVWVRLSAGRKLLTSPPETENGRFELIGVAAPVFITDRDDQILDDVFNSAELLNRPDLINAADLAAFATAPVGPLSGENWRRFHGRIPSKHGRDPVPLRKPLGQLMAAVQADMVVAFDDAADEMRYSPRRRRPHPGATTPDRTVYAHHFVAGHGVTDLGWTIKDEPKKRYGTRITVEFPPRAEPYRPASFDLAEAAIDKAYPTAVVHDDPVEQALFGAPLERGVKQEEFRPITANGITDAAEFEGGSRSQSQLMIVSPLGHYALGWELLDLIDFDPASLPTLALLGPGHIRTIRRDWLRQRAEVESWHLTFCETALGVAD